MQNSYLLNSKKYFLLFYSSAFFFIFNIHAAEDEMVKIKPIKANQKSEELYKTKIKYRAKTKQNTNNFSFDIILTSSSKVNISFPTNSKVSFLISFSKKLVKLCILHSSTAMSNLYQFV